MNFEWSAHKAKINLTKHGVTFEEAATVFEDPLSLEMDDLKHSTDTETRSFRIGVSELSRELLVVFTLRGRTKDEEEITRIISARPASRKEKALYHRKDNT